MIRGIMSLRGGQVERMNRTIKKATVKRYHYDSHDQLRSHLADFMATTQLRTQVKNTERPHTLRIHRQNPDFRARSVHPKSDPLNAGTVRLGNGGGGILVVPPPSVR